jgi:hypothetical protein
LQKGFSSPHLTRRILRRLAGWSLKQILLSPNLLASDASCPDRSATDSVSVCGLGLHVGQMWDERGIVDVPPRGGRELAFINVGDEASTHGKGDSWDKGNTWPTWCSIGTFSHTTWVSPKGVPGLDVEGGREYLVYGHVLSLDGKPGPQLGDGVGHLMQVKLAHVRITCNMGVEGF